MNRGFMLPVKQLCHASYWAVTPDSQVKPDFSRFPLLINRFSVFFYPKIGNLQILVLHQKNSKFLENFELSTEITRLSFVKEKKSHCVNECC